MAPKPRLGERLVEAGLITHQQLDKALRVHAATGEQLGRTLVKLGYLDEDSLIRTLCADAHIPYVTLSDDFPERAALSAVTHTLASRHQAVPLREEAGRLLVAMADPFSLESVTALERAAGRAIKIVAAPRDAITQLIARAYDGSLPVRANGKSLRPETVPHSSAPGSSPHYGAESTVRAVKPRDADHEPLPDIGRAATLGDEIIKRGVALGATDIHIEPTEDGVKLRYRLDGLLQEGGSLPKAVQAPLISRIKIVAGLDIAETRLPQDGRTRFTESGRNVDIRVSTFPTIHGEDIVLRVLDRANAALELEALGMNPENLGLLREVLRHPHGLIAVTGPTGSGKTTTLYSALVEINTAERCTMTLEDPVEYELPAVRQSQINLRAGLSFASGLRSMLRHDPDIILVGEIRDGETLQIALSAALTGHLVLTTLHTTNAAGAIPRLLDMGAEPFVLASSLKLLMSQRLVRLLCSECKVAMELPPGVAEQYGLAGTTLYGPRGCGACRRRGFRGRTGIFELLPVTEEMAPAIYDRRPAEEIHRLSGRPTMFDDGLAKVRAGATSLDELLRVIVS